MAQPLEGRQAAVLSWMQGMDLSLQVAEGEVAGAEAGVPSHQLCGAAKDPGSLREESQGMEEPEAAAQDSGTSLRLPRRNRVHMDRRCGRMLLEECMRVGRLG